MSRKTTRRLLVMLVFTLVVAFLCTSSFAAGLSIEEENVLYKAAKEEGKLRMGGPCKERGIRRLLKNFEMRYPGIEVEYVRKSSGPFTRLVESERMARRITFDVINTTLPQDAERWAREGYFMAYKPVNFRFFPEELKDPNGKYYPMALTVMLGGYNNEVISPKEAPKSYKDFLDPKWKGMISNSSPKRGGTGLAAAANVIRLYGWEYIEKLSKSAIAVKGHGTVCRMVISGERPLAWEITGYRAIEHDRETPNFTLIWPEEGPPVCAFYLGIPSKAPHSNAAKLMVNYIMSREGQEMLSYDADLWSPVPDVSPPRGFAPLKYLPANYIDTRWLLEHAEYINTHFDELYGLK